MLWYDHHSVVVLTYMFIFFDTPVPKKKRTHANGCYVFFMAGLTVTQIGGLDGDGNADEVDKTQTWQTVQTADSHTEQEKEGGNLGKSKERFEMDKPRQKMEEVEKEGMLVAGIHLQQETREGGQKTSTDGQENTEDKGGNEEQQAENVKNAKHGVAAREKGDHTVVSNLAPLLNTTQPGAEIKIPATKPTTANHVLVPTEAAASERSVLLFEDLLTEVLHSPGRDFKRNEVEGKASPNVEEVMVENISLEPEQKEPQTAGETNPKVHAATPKPTSLQLTTEYLKTEESNSRLKSNKNNPLAKLTKQTPKNTTSTQTRSDTDKLTATQNKAPPTRPNVTKPSAKTQVAAVVTPSVKQVKGNKTSKNKKTNKLKEKGKKKDNRTQKLAEKEEGTAPTHFPYFLDDYCPPECACYGR